MTSSSFQWSLHLLLAPQPPLEGREVAQVEERLQGSRGPCCLQPLVGFSTSPTRSWAQKAGVLER